jgi:hypothetical protein
MILEQRRNKKTGTIIALHYNCDEGGEPWYELECLDHGEMSETFHAYATAVRQLIHYCPAEWCSGCRDDFLDEAIDQAHERYVEIYRKTKAANS